MHAHGKDVVLRPASLIRALPLVATALLVVTTGCSSPSLSSWQDSLTTYVREKGYGDPTVLRDITLADNRSGFSVIGHHDTRESTDVNGLLLGHEQIGGRMWFVYLVGLVEKERVTDIRLAAVSMEGGKSIWKRGGESGQALRVYRNYGMKQASERFPDRKWAPPRYTGFPRPDDVFRLNNTNGKLVATHEASGARWQLTLTNQNVNGDGAAAVRSAPDEWVRSD